MDTGCTERLKIGIDKFTFKYQILRSFVVLMAYTDPKHM